MKNILLFIFGLITFSFAIYLFRVKSKTPVENQSLKPSLFDRLTSDSKDN